MSYYIFIRACIEKKDKMVLELLPNTKHTSVILCIYQLSCQAGMIYLRESFSLGEILFHILVFKSSGWCHPCRLDNNILPRNVWLELN